MRRIIIAVSLLVPLVLAGCGRHAVHGPTSIPSFPTSTLYRDARTQLLADGWTPITDKDAMTCAAGDARCAGFPEMKYCSGPLVAECTFTWKSGDKLIEITGSGEAPQTVLAINCLSGCPAAPAPAPASAPVSAPTDSAPPDPGKDFLDAGIKGILYLVVSVGTQNGGYIYCKAEHGTPMNAQFAVEGDSSKTDFIRQVPFQVAEPVAAQGYIPMTFSFTRPGLWPLDCYDVDPSFAQRYYRVGWGLYVPIARIETTDIEFVNEFTTQTMSGPATARSYHVRFSFYVNEPPTPGTHGVRGIDRVVWMDTCVIVHDNVENKWSFVSCNPTASGN